MSCLEEFLDKPTVLQLRRPIAAVYAEEYSEEAECGVATPIRQRVPRRDGQGNPVVNQQGQPIFDEAPLTAQVLLGTVEKVGDDGIIFETNCLASESVKILIFVPSDCIESVSLADSALPKEQTAPADEESKIITP